MQPLVGLLVRYGVTYTALAPTLKRVFVKAAEQEIQQQGMKRTDSAITLLSGVHRKDVRDMQLTSESTAIGGATPGTPAQATPLSLVGQVVARWLTGRGWQSRGLPKVLPRSGPALSFDALVSSVSKDIRPRAMLDEMLRLGVVAESSQGLSLLQSGLVPHAGFDAMGEAMALNLHDHAAAAAANLRDDAKLLEQAVYVDDITAESATHLHAVARQAWQTAFATVIAAAQARFDHDAAKAAPAARVHRARFGSYFFTDVQPQAAWPDARSKQKSPNTKTLKAKP